MAVSFLFLSCSSRHDRPSGKPGQAGMNEAVPVTVATVVQKDIPVQIHAIGSVEAYSTVSVKSRVVGQLVEVNFKEGQEVKKGELIFLIDPRPFKAALSQTEANLAKDIAQMKKAEADARRYTDLFKRGIVSQQDYDQNRTNFEAMRATVKADEAAVENAKVQLGYCYIYSPIDGRIGKLMVNQGNMVKDNDTVLAVINQIKPIYVDFSVPEQELPRIRRYMAEERLKVEAIIPSDREHPAVGELTFVNNQVDTNTGTILLKGLFPNENEALWPGQFVNVVLTLTRQPNAVVVPSTAVQTGQQGNYVFVVKPDLTVESRPIILGNDLGREVVIANGLQPGERVVTEGQLRLAPGVKVEIKGGATEGGTQKAQDDGSGSSEIRY
ncbi:MAG: efflux RND transporter periplasmic adaptor subunit [Candidatus Dadabacteria bacterium]